MDCRCLLPEHETQRERVGERRDLVLQRADLLRLLARVLASDSRQQAQEIGSLQNKVAALADALPLRLVLGQHTSTIHIRRIIDRGTVMVCDFSGLGEEPSRLFGALLVSSFAQAAEARSDIAEAERRDYTLYIDEFQNFASLAFAKILSEARKWRLSIVLCSPVHRSDIRARIA